MNIFFREQGQGTPIILIHGFCETHEIWNGFDTKLSNYGRVISIDLPGFGNSPITSIPFTIEAIAEILLTWLKARDLKNAVLVGHSLGGYIALAMTALAPSYFKKLVLFHSSIYADTDEKKANRNKVIEFVNKNGVEPFLQTFVPSLFYKKNHPEMERVKSICSKTPALTLIEYTRAMRDRPSKEDFFKSYMGQSVILAGEKDEIIPIELSRKMASTGLKSIFLSLPDTGHLGMIEAEAKILENVSIVISS